MKILVTGGSGFIGSHIVEQLAKEKNNEIFIFFPKLIEPLITISAPNTKRPNPIIARKISINNFNYFS